MEAKTPEEAAVIGHNQMGFEYIGVKAAWHQGAMVYQIFDVDGWMFNSVWVDPV